MQFRVWGGSSTRGDPAPEPTSSRSPRPVRGVLEVLGQGVEVAGGGGAAGPATELVLGMADGGRGGLGREVAVGVRGVVPSSPKLVTAIGFQAPTSI